MLFDAYIVGKKAPYYDITLSTICVAVDVKEPKENNTTT